MEVLFNYEPVKQGTITVKWIKFCGAVYLVPIPKHLISRDEVLKIDRFKSRFRLIRFVSKLV